MSENGAENNENPTETQNINANENNNSLKEENNNNNNNNNNNSQQNAENYAYHNDNGDNSQNADPSRDNSHLQYDQMDNFNGNNNNNQSYHQNGPTNGLSNSNSYSNANLFVNYLPPSVNDDILRQMFEPYGEIESCKVMLDLETGQSRCFGFVKYKTGYEAEQAAACVNGFKLENKTLVVKPANTSSVPATAKGTPSNNVYIKGVPLSMTDEHLQSLFTPYGNITETKILVDPETNYSRGMGFVRYTTIEEANLAIENLNGQLIPGAVKPVIVKFSDTEDERKYRKSKQQAKRGMRYTPYSMPPAYPSYPGYPSSLQYSNYPAASSMSFGTQNFQQQQQPQQQERNLYIYHLPANADDSLLYRIFSPYGAIESVKVIADPQTGLCKGYGFVKMVNYVDAWNAVQMLNGVLIGDSQLQVSFKKSKH